MSEQDERTREILKKVRAVEIRTHRMVTDALSGAYHSVFKGQGMDFEEVREYAPGDDVRAIDWNVTAKMDRPYLKLFREERELTIIIALDLSASGLFGSVRESKRERAAEIASVLAFSAARNNDKVGLLLFTSEVEKFIAPRKGRSHILRVIREMLFYQPQHKGTDIKGAMDHLNRVVRRRAVVFVLSDFLPSENPEAEAQTEKALRISNRRHDVTCVQVSDPREQTLPNVGLITLEDAETGETIEVNTASTRFRRDYARSNAKRLARTERKLRQTGAGLIMLRTDQPYAEVLRRYLERRTPQRH